MRFVLNIFDGDVAYGKPPKLPSGIYFYCSRCEKRCGPLEAGCEDDDGKPYCAACTRRMWTESEPDDELARNADFLNSNVRRFNACSIRKLSSVLAGLRRPDRDGGPAAPTCSDD